MLLCSIQASVPILNRWALGLDTDWACNWRFDGGCSCLVAKVFILKKTFITLWIQTGNCTKSDPENWLNWGRRVWGEFKSLGIHYTTERFGSPTLKTSSDYRIVKTYFQMAGFWGVFRIRGEKKEVIWRGIFYAGNVPLDALQTCIRVTASISCAPC